MTLAGFLKRYIPGVDPDDMPMFGLWKSDPASDRWHLTAGGNYETNRYPVILSNITLGDGVWHTYTMHYRAAEQVMDAYMDGVLVAADIARTDGYYGANRCQVETMRTSASTTEVDYVILGQKVDFIPQDILATVNLPGYVGDLTDIPVNVKYELRQGVDVVSTGVVALDENSQFQILGQAPGSYDLAVTGPVWPETVASLTVVEGVDPTEVTVNMNGGDLNGDGAVEESDFGILSAYWYLNSGL